jgi:hypothetical protein
MSISVVIVNDFVTDRRTVTMLDGSHFERMEAVWEHEDQILIDMQGNDFFAGRRRWCDLNPTHYRLMVTRNLTIAAGITDAERTDPNHPVIRSLHLLMAGLVICLQRRSECLIELMRIARIGENEVSFDFAASLNMAVDLQKPKNGLRIIVDNEKPVA